MATTSSTTGINVSGIAKIEEAIKKYKNNISKSFDFANLKKAASAAVKGSRAEQDLNKYMAHIDQTLKSYIKYLDDSIDDLKGVQSKYYANDKNSSTFTGSIPKPVNESKK